VGYDYKEFHRRNLPHIHSPGANLFVTFRLAGSIPKQVLRQWKSERDWLDFEMKRVSKEASQTKKLEVAKHEKRLRAFHRAWFVKFEDILDKAQDGPTWLRDERVAKLVADSLECRDGNVYRLHVYCIMPNHVHVVFAPSLNEESLREKSTVRGLRYESKDPPLDVIMHSLKSYTANEANKLCARSGQFWEVESYDHVIRSEAEYRRIRSYVLNNPVKAGLVKTWRDWRWSWIRN
jgi:REP-associated tyrosine transposase